MKKFLFFVITNIFVYTNVGASETNRMVQKIHVGDLILFKIVAGTRTSDESGEETIFQWTDGIVQQMNATNVHLVSVRSGLNDQGRVSQNPGDFTFYVKNDEEIVHSVNCLESLCVGDKVIRFFTMKKTEIHAGFYGLLQFLFFGYHEEIEMSEEAVIGAIFENGIVKLLNKYGDRISFNFQEITSVKKK